ncbi:MAG: EAL domain-containing protein [Bryobacteraceae bacterium]|jgi:diguanylate cyclase (GGDEF)-like protein
MDLARVNANLKRLHELAAATYESANDLALAYLRAGCDMFGFQAGAIRGSEPIVYDPENILKLPEQRMHAASLNGHGQVVFAGSPISEDDSELFAMMVKDLSRELNRHTTLNRLSFEARHDRLTGLPNRFHFMDLFESALERAIRRSEILALLFLDLDRFKQVNDTLGHLLGDRILQQVGFRLKALLPSPRDLAARMGGDEFMVVLTGLPDATAALLAANRILDELREAYRVDEYELFVTASAGISVFPQDGGDAPALLHRADLAMYRAKAEGGSKLQPFSSDLQGRAVELFALENDLRRAVERQELELSYQPLVTMNGELDGLEALLAWNHPRLGRISPCDFIPIAEESGLIVPIGSWVITQACVTGSKWRADGLRRVRVSVNVSALQFARSDFVDSVATALALTGFPAESFELELTETFVLRDIEESARRMRRIRNLGVNIAIDDFGTGYSSLSYLRRLPANSLKIDQSFLHDLVGPNGSIAVVQGIVLLAHSMGLKVVAEGVETEEQLQLLREAGCDKVQGHLYGEPLREAEARELLARAEPLMSAAGPRER